MVRFRRINTKERRASRRVLASDVIPQGITRLTSGQVVRLMNIALNGGILINSKTMLSPGASIRLRLKMPESEMILEGRVHRCKVIGLKMAKIQYEAVILLEKGFPEPLKEKLSQLDGENSFAGNLSEAISPDSIKLQDTAHLWILNSPDAEAQA